MPRPPILPTPDREAIFNGGTSWDDWLANPDEASQGASLKEFYANYELSDATKASLQALDGKVNIIAIAETWCGDVIRHTPLLIRMVEAAGDKAEIRFITRAQDTDFFTRFVTNGGEAIPKFVFCSREFVEVGNWGPMSTTPRKWIAQGKAAGDVGAARKKVGEFYTNDNEVEATKDFLELFQTATLTSFPE